MRWKKEEACEARSCHQRVPRRRLCRMCRMCWPRSAFWQEDVNVACRRVHIRAIPACSGRQFDEVRCEADRKEAELCLGWKRHGTPNVASFGHRFAEASLRASAAAGSASGKRFVSGNRRRSLPRTQPKLRGFTKELLLSLRSRITTTDLLGSQSWRNLARLSDPKQVPSKP